MQTTLRRLTLVVIALVFTAIAVGNLIAPQKMAEGIGLVPHGVDGLSEVRAVYVGVWLATAFLFGWSARRPEERALYVACALLLGGQVLGRLISVVLDGIPSASVAPIAIAEAVGTVALVALRPRA